MAEEGTQGVEGAQGPYHVVGDAFGGAVTQAQNKATTLKEDRRIPQLGKSFRECKDRFQCCVCKDMTATKWRMSGPQRNPVGTHVQQTIYLTGVGSENI